jgi:hypothetical protein
VHEAVGFLEQMLQRTDIPLHDDRTGHAPQELFVVRFKFQASVHDHRVFPQAEFLFQRFEDLDAGHVRQIQIEHHAVEVPAFQGGQRLFARGDCRDSGVGIGQQFDDAVALNIIVFDDEQFAHWPLDKRRDLG